MKLIVDMPEKELQHIYDIANSGKELPVGLLADLIRIVAKGIPQEQEQCDDVVSRQAVDVLVDELARAISDERCCIPRGRSTATIMQDILDLPSVRPQEQTGNWRHYEGMLICSECGAEFYDDIMEYCGDDVPKCCPNCGCRMVEPRESKKQGEVIVNTCNKICDLVDEIIEAEKAESEDKE